MSCGVPYEELAAFAECDLPADRRAVVEQHVAACEGCRKRLAGLREIDAALRSLPAERPSAETILAARRLLSEETRPRRESEILTLEEVAAFLRIEQEELRPFVTDLPAFELGGQIRVRQRGCSNGSSSESASSAAPAPPAQSRDSGRSNNGKESPCDRRSRYLADWDQPAGCNGAQTRQ